MATFKVFVYKALFSKVYNFKLLRNVQIWRYSSLAVLQNNKFISNVSTQSVSLPVSVGKIPKENLSQSRWFSQSSPKTTRVHGEIGFEELQALLLSKDIQLIDVREPKEIEDYGKIENSVNIPLGELTEALKLSDEHFIERYKCSKPQMYHADIVFYSLGSIKSMAALELAVKLGFKKARHYKGGWEEYTAKLNIPLKKK